MTTHEIDALTPGRELDALISREVFGQCPHDTPKAILDENDENQCPCFTCSKQVCADCGLTLIDHTGDFDQDTIRYFDEEGWICPRYSSDLNAAMLVVGKLTKQGLIFDLAISETSVDAAFRVETFPASTHWCSKRNINNQAIAQAICLAALKFIKYEAKGKINQ